MGPYLQVDGLERAEGALDIGQRLVAVHAFVAIHAIGLDAGAQHIQTIERGLFGDAVVVARVSEVLADLVAIHNLANCQADLIGPFGATRSRILASAVSVACNSASRLAARCSARTGLRQTAGGCWEMRATRQTVTTVLLLAICLHAVLLTGRSGESNGAESATTDAPRIPVDATVVRLDNVAAAYEGTATLVAETTAMVVSKATGVLVEEGALCAPATCSPAWSRSAIDWRQSGPGRISIVSTTNCNAPRNSMPGN
jgi:hypothetical protein